LIKVIVSRVGRMPLLAAASVFNRSAPAYLLFLAPLTFST
jgi:hypothetical protein